LHPDFPVSESPLEIVHLPMPSAPLPVRNIAGSSGIKLEHAGLASASIMSYWLHARFLDFYFTTYLHFLVLNVQRLT
jgi:hypothetical protein